MLAEDWHSFIRYDVELEWTSVTVLCGFKQQSAG